jgi:hypothetical protein
MNESVHQVRMENSEAGTNHWLSTLWEVKQVQSCSKRVKRCQERSISSEMDAKS